MIRLFFRNENTGKLEYNGSIETKTLDEAFVKSQNSDYGPWTVRGYVYDTPVNHRSSSVGDVFINELDEAFIVAPSGFLRFPQMDNAQPNDNTPDTLRIVLGYNEC